MHSLYKNNFIPNHAFDKWGFDVQLKIPIGYKK